MKKIGILTFHNASNYGAVLQAYALQTALQKETKEYFVEIIDYDNCEIRKTKKMFLIVGRITLKNIVAALINIPCRIKKEEGISKFISKYLVLSSRVNSRSLNEIKQTYAKVIVGSDQVWNYNLTANDNEYYLPGNYREKYAYAVSIGNDISFDEVRKRELEEFKKISVRERDAQEFLEEKTDVKCSIVCDPTMLLEENDWKRLLPNKQFIESYILVYSINPDVNLMKFAFQIHEKTGWKIRYISMNAMDVSKIRNVDFEKTPSPEMFLALIKNAKVVLTNSFHGTVFSVVFRRSFWVEIDYIDYRNNRISNLLENLGLEDRIIESDTVFNMQDINWEKVYKKVLNMRFTSYQFLKGVLD